MTDNGFQISKNKRRPLRFGAFCHLALVGCFLVSCTAIRPPPANLPPREGIIAGETITVQGKENVYAVARHHNVSMRDLIVLNDLKPPFILRAGEKLTLPAGHAGDAEAPGAEVPVPATAAIGAVEESTLPPLQAPPAPTHSSVVTQYTNTPQPVAPAATITTSPTAEALTTPSPMRSVPTTATIMPSQQVASINPSTAKPPPEAPSMSFVWPVQGPVLSAFGPKGQGLSNDGINIGAPKGAPVVAAASGIVVYAGNEMKGFGNLILIRHEGGWVTAYAHLDRALVNKDAVVAQGDMIGTVGKTGNVASPQLHFETRYEGKPIDPAGVIKG